MKITDHFSPNFEDRMHPIDMVVLHYTDMKSAVAALDRLCDPQAKVSAHYLISKSGEIVRLVSEDKVAYHAGISYWRGRSSLNHHSIGIELDNLGHLHGPESFAEEQIKSLVNLMKEIRTRHHIPNYNIIGHSDVAPSRKKDPGELFPWERMAAEGQGIWSPLLETMPIQDELTFSPSRHDYEGAQKGLADIGYQIQVTGSLTLETEQVLTAFQRHFLPLNVTGLLDAETLQALNIIKELY